jgi:hypothetical protein
VTENVRPVGSVGDIDQEMTAPPPEVGFAVFIVVSFVNM